MAGRWMAPSFWEWSAQGVRKEPSRPQHLALAALGTANCSLELAALALLSKSGPGARALAAQHQGRFAVLRTACGPLDTGHPLAP